MINPLNELSSVYTQNIAEGYAPGDVDQKVGAVTAIPKDEREAAKARLLAKAKAKRAAKLKEQEEVGKIGGGNLKKLATKATKRVDADVDGDVDTDDMKSSEMGEYVPSPNGKKLKTKVRFESYSNWREDLIEVVDPAESEDVVGSSKRDGKEIKEKNVKNKIKINPPQGVTEGFQELGGVVLEMYELNEASYEAAAAKVNAERAAKRAKEDKRMTITQADKKANTPAYQNYMRGDKRYKMVGEKLDVEKASMGEVIKDFRKSDAPQFKGKSKEKKREMAIAAKLEADRGIEDQMRISKEYNRKSPEERKAMVKKALSGIKKGTPKKDTRTDAQKMTDATGPRPGSRYRGD